ncbi:MAG: hypothetical protein MZV70_65345 [Desulfobacterales bacterium]|nr:hypothetical protein [Desulfobacterales bacterium]
MPSWGRPGTRSSFIGHGIGLELIEPPIIARGRDASARGGHGVRAGAQAGLRKRVRRRGRERLPGHRSRRPPDQQGAGGYIHLLEVVS